MEDDDQDDGDPLARADEGGGTGDDDLDDDDLDEDDDNPLAHPRKRKDVKKPGSRPRTTDSAPINYGYDERQPEFTGTDADTTAYIQSSGEGSAPWLKPTPWKKRRRTQDEYRNWRCTF
jgi:hypothetical protein